MPVCYKCCDYYHLGFCTKYNEMILVSRNPAHMGLLIHPLHHLSLYYDSNRKDISHLIDVADKYLKDDTSKSICKQYKQKGYITYKQRKCLVYNILHCCEETPRTYDGDITFVQVE